MKIWATIIVVLLVSAAVPMTMPSVIASTSRAANCPLPASIPGVDNSTAQSLALTSVQFREDVSGRTYFLNGVAASLLCGKLETLDANFYATDSAGSKEDVVVAFNVSAAGAPTKVFGVFIMSTAPFNYYNTGDYHSTIWSGYAFCDGHNSGGSTCQTPPFNPVQGAHGLWTQPSVSQPSGANQPGCGYPACDLSIWVGLDDGAASNDILQTGSDVNIASCPLCVGTPTLWWEAFPAGPNWCPPGYSQQGHTITAEVYLSSGNQYYVDSYDHSTGYQCASSPSPYTWSHTPYYMEFILERRYDLAQFGNFDFQGYVQYEGSTFPITRPYGNGWFTMWWMQNPDTSGTKNICSGTWSSPNCYDYVTAGLSGYGSFPNTWITSQNT